MLQRVIEKQKFIGLEVIIYEPTLTDDRFNGLEVVHSFDEFATRSDVILANRLEAELEPVQEKVYTRDLFIINNHDIFNKYKKELKETSKEIRWKDSNRRTKIYKIIGNSYIYIRYIEYKIWYFIKRRPIIKN